MLDANDGDVAARLDMIERRISGLAQRLGERKRPRDGRAVLSVRAGDDRIARVHEAARRRGCTLTAIMNEAIDYVIGPSADQLSEPREKPAAFMRRTLPSDAARHAISNSLAEQARLAGSDAAVMVDRRSRDERSADKAGMITDKAVRGLLGRP
jgi:hypothetical protein